MTLGLDLESQAKIQVDVHAQYNHLIYLRKRYFALAQHCAVHLKVRENEVLHVLVQASESVPEPLVLATQISYAALCKACDCCQTTVVNALAGLQSYGLVAMAGGKGGYPNIYLFPLFALMLKKGIGQKQQDAAGEAFIKTWITALK